MKKKYALLMLTGLLILGACSQLPAAHPVPPNVTGGHPRKRPCSAQAGAGALFLLLQHVHLISSRG
ncbi:hypothetical protein GCM10022631_08660 [Deinococcus rubellus]